MAQEQPPLSERRAFILATVVYEYIQTAEPVGSGTLTQKYQLGVSSATIRNEMAELEAAGYLVQPHTSAGRVPSDSGYRTYVDCLMDPSPLGADEQRRIREELLVASRELDDMIGATTRLIGRLTNSFVFSIAPKRESAAFRHLQLIWFGERNGLAIVVTATGVAAQLPFDVVDALDADALTGLSNRINAKFGGKRLGTITYAAIQDVVTACGLGAELVTVVYEALQAARGEDRVITAAGTQNLLDQPEFQDLRKLRSILNLIEERKALYDLVAEAMSGSVPLVKIGQELGEGEMSACSVIAMPYRITDDAVGAIALLGPRRMPYARLLSIMAGTADSLTHRFAEDER